MRYFLIYTHTHTNECKDMKYALHSPMDNMIKMMIKPRYILLFLHGKEDKLELLQRRRGELGRVLIYREYIREGESSSEVDGEKRRYILRIGGKHRELAL